MNIIFMGTPDFAVCCLLAMDRAGYKPALVVTAPDKPRGRGLRMMSPPVADTARLLGLSLVQTQSVRTEAFTDTLRGTAPDLIVTAAYGRLLPPSVLKIPRLGCINVHASLLPLYRGASPISACLAEGRAESGITVMLMDEGMDTGDILAQKEVPVPPDMHCEDLCRLLADAGAKLLIETLDRITGVPDREALKAMGKPQDHSRATAAPPIGRQDVCIEWNRPARDIHNLVRSAYGWPVAWCETDRGVLKIWKTRIVSEEQRTYPATTEEPLLPGQVIDTGKDGIRVCCGIGEILIEELQPASGKRMRAADYARGHDTTGLGRLR